MNRQIHRLVSKFIIAFLAISCLCLNACRGGVSEEPEHLDLQISVNKSFSAAIGDEVTFNYYGTIDIPATSDRMVFQSVSGEEYDCPILRVGGSSFAFKISCEIPTGRYELVLRRGELEQKLGSVYFTFIKRSVVEEKEGFSIYGQIVCEDKGVPDVVVSDGIQVTTTDENGVYYLNSDKKYNYVWMSVPSGYEALSDGVLPLFCTTLKAPANVNERVDFELVRADNDNFTLYVLGDMHLAKRNEDLKQFKLFADDFNAVRKATPGKEYVLTLGDMTWDLYWYSQRYSFPEYLETVNSYFKDIQFFHTMGNHDNDYEKIGDFNKEIPYRTYITPTFYSFNIGQLHFIVMDDIDFNDIGAGTDLRHLYKENFTADQMEWLKKDLSHVSKDTPIIFSSHAPVFRPSVLGWIDGLTGADAPGEGNTGDLIGALKGYTVHIFTGHTHRTFNYDRLENQGFIEHNAGSLCGSWWWSGYLTPGINLAQDGAPGGYMIVQVNGKEIDWVYKATGYPASHQFHSYDMNEVKKTVTMSLGHEKAGFAKYVQSMAEHEDNTVLLNIWNYDPEWKISVKEEGKELEVQARFDYDPLHIIAMTAKRFMTLDKPNFITALWTHFFEVKASSPDSTLEIEVTDRFGNVSRETMTRPKPFSTAAYLAP